MDFDIQKSIETLNRLIYMRSGAAKEDVTQSLIDFVKRVSAGGAVQPREIDALPKVAELLLEYLPERKEEPGECKK